MQLTELPISRMRAILVVPQSLLDAFDPLDADLLAAIHAWGEMELPDTVCIGGILESAYRGVRAKEIARLLCANTVRARHSGLQRVRSNIGATLRKMHGVERVVESRRVFWVSK